MGGLRGFNGLEVPPFGEPGGVLIGREAGRARLAGGRVMLVAEHGEEGRPPRLRAVRRSFLGRVRRKKRGEG